jgi:hypothetical protein
MTTARGLEGGYRRLLRWYPASYRERHEEEILGVMMAAAQPGQRRPGAGESADLLWSALKIRIRMTLGGADSQPWADALALAGVLLPLLMLLLRLTEFLDRGVQYAFGTPADLLMGAYGEPGSFARSFQLNPYPVALTGNVTGALTAGPVPVLILAVLVCLGWRRAAAVFAAFVPLAFLGIALTNGYTVLAAARLDVTLYAYGLEALILVTAPGTAAGWRVLRPRSAARLAALLGGATVAAGGAMNGGFWPLFHGRLAVPRSALGRLLLRERLASLPHGFVDRLLGIGPGGWGAWLLYQGTLVAVIATVVVIMLVASPVSRRVLFLLAVPFALGAGIYLCSLISPPPPASVGNTLVGVPLLLIFLAAMALSLRHRRSAGPDVPGRPAAPRGA